ncbi:Elf1 family transcription elongation factor [Schizosaccharomyces cryophilus OY26]|uniref:Transcription elongation factor 1 homolog n=1 Tax=Schizosaccharomyces cryophilus (strain OY26 / ATCC MYA-4695 / CBS 11777 / NBRC 106824 / NRRL Y48691) TaxID=653667 RepID=S9XFZ2_SCHCR|nr:Elf1 family transcription elongation factor [Schizosaccharomyces cryophilus OY26]EPY52561.1 Elf1 family transcription elongation factor [Schizosaccharomyces cryophilus OY26]
MGKRKASKRIRPTRRAAPLETTSVSCTLDKQSGVGNLHCKICGQSHQCIITALSAPIDVYSDWIDACDTVAHQAQDDKGGDGNGASADVRADNEGNYSGDEGY